MKQFGRLALVIGILLMGLYMVLLYTVKFGPNSVGFEMFGAPDNTPYFLAGAAFSIIGTLMVAFGKKSEVNELPSSQSHTFSNSVNTLNSSLEQEIQKLNEMKKRGVIDDAEYKRLRENLISRS